MKVTPLDLKKADFKRVLRGYEPEDVNELMAAAAETLEEMVRDNRELKEKVNQLGEQLKSYQSMEKTLNETLITAQKSGDATRQAAERESELIIAKAEVQAEKLVEEAKSELKRIRYQIEMLQHEKEAYMVKMRSLVASQWKLLQEDFEPRKVDDSAGEEGDLEVPADKPVTQQEKAPEQPSGDTFEKVLADEQAAKSSGQPDTAEEQPEEAHGEEQDVGDLSDKLSRILGGENSEATGKDSADSDSERFFLGPDEDDEAGGAAGLDSDDLESESGKKEKPEVFWGDDEPEGEESEKDK